MRKHLQSYHTGISSERVLVTQALVLGLIMDRKGGVFESAL